MSTGSKDFARRSREALANTDQRRTITDAAALFSSLRERAFGQWSEAETRLANAASARLRALTHLPDLLVQAEAEVTRNGGTVHWAGSADEARSIILSIAREKGVKSVVKGKSMVTEEIGLNPALEAEGMEVFETDLGEYIVQLAHEPPSHIIAPALHKSRRDVAELFARTLGETGEEPEELTAIARKRLRRAFLEADMGITGVNFVIAESGVVGLLENEGNIRASTTCPRVHVALMGLEKVVATAEDAVDVLQVLPRSCTGQAMPAYFSLLGGPRRPGESDGPEEFHLVILDNGRSRIHSDPLLMGALACVRCGGCVNSCPVYQRIGGHAYGATYSGPIGILLSSLLDGGEAHAELPGACTTCGACAEVCPVGVNHPRLIIELRRRMREEGEQGGCGAISTLMGKAFAFAAKHPALFTMGASSLRAVDPELKKLSRLSPLRGAAATRSLPSLREPFAKRWPSLRKSLDEDKS
ncbi:iron-sulfur cluster binding protein [Desulfovibrio sp. X2]|uniref:LutB/LldF family L-lactate oxidation iron-sulfur protein n=1 Tax=Desulfovibrio sp. X2 TaxID=941449 RepID=UPI000358939C|nr:LutB/LldF family L-lactate oxidation iron-sulfur protein [Desulfovibrio sp. X2]EPR43370.1 iron-sulfur cluster binding protein [Desulfovibrio sp. X2]